MSNTEIFNVLNILAENKMPVSKEKRRELIKTSLKNLDVKLSKEKKNDLGKVLVKIFEEGLSPKDAIKLPPIEFEKIQLAAYSLYDKGNFKQAFSFYKVLNGLDPTNLEILMGLAACYHQLKSYKEALTYYITAGLLLKNDPTPYFYAYDCMINLNSDLMASNMLETAISLAEDNPKYALIKERSKLLIQALKTKDSFKEETPK